jgi:hypothetical protein
LRTTRLAVTLNRSSSINDATERKGRPMPDGPHLKVSFLAANPVDTDTLRTACSRNRTVAASRPYGRYSTGKANTWSPSKCCTASGGERHERFRRRARASALRDELPRTTPDGMRGDLCPTALASAIICYITCPHSFTEVSMHGRLLALLSLLLCSFSAFADEERAVEVIKKSGGSVERDPKAPGKPVVAVSFGNGVMDADLKELTALKNLRTLVLSADNKVTDAGLKELAPLKGLKRLDLSGTKLTAAGLKEIARLEGLRELVLSGRRVTDEALKELTPLKKLRRLELYGTKVSAGGMKEVVALAGLEELYLSSTFVHFERPGKEGALLVQ